MATIKLMDKKTFETIKSMASSYIFKFMIFPFMAVQILMIFFDKLSIAFVVCSFFTIFFYILWKIWTSWGFMGAGRFEKPSKSSVFIIFLALSITATMFLHDGYGILKYNIVYNEVTQEVVYVGDSESSSYYVFADSKNLKVYNFKLFADYTVTAEGVTYDVSYDVIVDKQYILNDLDGYDLKEEAMLQLLMADISQNFDAYTTLDEEPKQAFAVILQKTNLELDDLNDMKASMREVIAKSASVKACEVITAAGYITEFGECAMQISNFSATKSED